MGHDSSPTGSSAFVEALAQGWQRLSEGFEQLLGGARCEESARARERLEELDQALRAQMVFEEELMIPPFELEAHEQGELLRAEHRQLCRGLDKVAGELAEGKLSRASADALVELVQSHARHAQQLLHSWADKCLPQRAKVRVLARQQAVWLESEAPPMPRSPIRSGVFAGSIDASGAKRSAK